MMSPILRASSPGMLAKKGCSRLDDMLPSCVTALTSS